MRIDRNVMRVQHVNAIPLNKSYGEWIAIGLLMTALDVIWMLIFWPLTFFVIAGFAWFLTTAAITTAGLREARDNRHHH